MPLPDTGIEAIRALHGIVVVLPAFHGQALSCELGTTRFHAASTPTSAVAAAEEAQSPMKCISPT